MVRAGVSRVLSRLSLFTDAGSWVIEPQVNPDQECSRHNLVSPKFPRKRIWTGPFSCFVFDCSVRGVARPNLLLSVLWFKPSPGCSDVSIP